MAKDRTGQSYSREASGPWMSAETLNNLPKARRDFDLSRDPSLKAQLEAEKKTEAQRREEQSGKGKGEKDAPKPQLKPPPHMRKAMVGPMLSGSWMGQHKNQVFVRAPQELGPSRDHARQRAEPEPSR